MYMDTPVPLEAKEKLICMVIYVCVLILMGGYRLRLVEKS
jgi:hypothetical protein